MDHPLLLRLSKPLEPFSLTFSGSVADVIQIKHANYPDDYEQNVLGTLFAFDYIGSGLQYGTALIACGLIAGNLWNGYFTLDRDGPRIALGDDEFLLGKSYYFHVPSSTENSYDYAISPSFEHWTFPHKNLPSSWTCCPADARRERGVFGIAPPSASNITAAMLQMLRTVWKGRISALEAKQPWFNTNSMGIIT